MRNVRWMSSRKTNNNVDFSFSSCSGSGHRIHSAFPSFRARYSHLSETYVSKVVLFTTTTENILFSDARNSFDFLIYTLPGNIISKLKSELLDKHVSHFVLKLTSWKSLYQNLV